MSPGSPGAFAGDFFAQLHRIEHTPFGAEANQPVLYFAAEIRSVSLTDLSRFSWPYTTRMATWRFCEPLTSVR